MPERGDAPAAAPTSSSSADLNELEGAPLTGATGDGAAGGRQPTPMPGGGSTPLVVRTGSLACTPTTQYGGDPYCVYRSTLKDVKIDIRTDDAGKVIAASVEAQAVEAAIDCPYPPIAPNQHLYHFVSATKLGSGKTRITLAPAKKNLPQASLVVDVDLAATKSTATLAWRRIDAGPPFDWLLLAFAGVNQ